MTLRFFRKDDSKELPSLTDEQLIAHYARTHNKEIIGLLYERYTHLLFTVCFKYLGNEADAEDMVMHIFEKLFVRLQTSEVHNFKSWIYTLTKNECLMQLRHNKSGQKAREESLKKFDILLMEDDAVPHTHSDENAAQRIRYLEKAISKLNLEQRKCIELFYLEEKTYIDVVQLTGYSYNEVKSHIQNGKRNLKISIERMEQNEP